MGFLLGVFVGAVGMLAFLIWLAWPWILLLGLLEPGNRAEGTITAGAGKPKAACGPEDEPGHLDP